MTNFENEPLYMRISSLLDGLVERVDENVSAAERQQAASKRNDELETRLTQELQLNKELCARLEAATRRDTTLRRVCDETRDKLAVAENDRARLQHAKDMYQIAKELTGVRWDFTAPADVAKGYVKSESRKLLEPFCVRASEGGEGGEGGLGGELWGRVRAAGAEGWWGDGEGSGEGKENCLPTSSKQQQ